MTEKEQLIYLVNNSSSLSDVLRKQGKSVSGTAIHILKQKLEEYGIPYFFVKEKEIKALSLNEILTRDKPYSSEKLKRRLIQEGLKVDVCEVCGQLPIWNGKPLKLQLDHINGNHNDNRLENLRIICPNCHTQTDTFGNKKSKRHNYCIDCGTEINLKSKRCVTCSRKTRRRFTVQPENRPSKEELLELIKTKSFVEIGKMFGVQDNAIRKWCKSYGIPHTKAQIKEMIISDEI